MGILDTIKKVFDMLPQIGTAVGTFALVLILFGAILGVFVYQTDQGNIPVDNDSATYISGQADNYSALTTDLWDSGTAVVGFIVIGVIIAVAGVFIGKKMLGGGGSKL